LFRLNHPSWVVEVLTGRDLVIIADTVAKVNS
jgi:hypothetical protein